MILDFERAKPVVYLDHKLSGGFLEESAQIELFRRETDTLEQTALSTVESAKRIAAIARENDRS